MGFPVLTYTVQENQLIVRQDRFLSDPNSDGEVEPSPYKYISLLHLFKASNRFSSLSLTIQLQMGCTNFLHY